ncbi:HAD-IIB family hydrolase [Culicoidibacter larvae]|uniref:HAD-IIB family hydrolase n=1 Tax=Culicoidibacter larvae TaxID=2579976 RepID=A0A5R8QDM3_9FIRM|nr:HAD-IIB family hydrolase [Culicoidibacter larvae]TLG75365.1 HAD-IIB family hydrolase [Culicoidibacter larvae]
MEKKLYVTDLDGTIAFKDHMMHDEDVAMVHKLRESGHYMAVATGRDMNGMLEFDQRIQVPFDYYILSNGALIMDRDFNVIYEQAIEHEVAMNIIKHYFEADEYFIATSNGREMTVVERIYENFQMGEYRSVLSYQEFLATPPEILFLNLQPYEREENSAIERAMALDAEIKAKFGDVVDCFRNKFFLDIGPKNISKGTGIEFLMQETKVKPEMIYAIGDSWNDIPMFAVEGVQSYSFDYAEPGVQELAKHIVPNSAACIREFLK